MFSVVTGLFSGLPAKWVAILLVAISLGGYGVYQYSHIKKLEARVVELTALNAKYIEANTENVKTIAALQWEHEIALRSIRELHASQAATKVIVAAKVKAVNNMKGTDKDGVVAPVLKSVIEEMGKIKSTTPP